MPKTVVFVHSYCLKKDGRNPSLMATHAILKGISTFHELRAQHLIVGAAYDTAEREYEMYQGMTMVMGIPEEKVHALLGICNSYDEAKRTITKTIELGATKLIVVAEKWHASRSERAFREVLPEGMTLKMVEFECDHFEELLEPSAIKRWRSKYRWSWILWNKLLEYLPTSFLQKMSGKMDK